MVISQIFQYLTRKQINNTETIVPQKTIQDIFLEQKNVSVVAISLYNMIDVANRDSYFKFRDKVSQLMNDWIWRQKFPKDNYNLQFMEYNVCRLNENFAREHSELTDTTKVAYSVGKRLPNMLDGSREINNANMPDTFYSVMPDNIYNNNFKITTRGHNDELVHFTKFGKDMMAQDYQNWDIWRPQNTYADFDFEKYRSFRDRYGYANAYIPRNVDRDPNSFGLTHADPLRASLTNQVYGYDNDEYMRAKGIK